LENKEWIQKRKLSLYIEWDTEVDTKVGQN